MVERPPKKTDGGHEDTYVHYTDRDRWLESIPGINPLDIESFSPSTANGAIHTLLDLGYRFVETKEFAPPPNSKTDQYIEEQKALGRYAVCFDNQYKSKATGIVYVSSFTPPEQK